MDNPMEFFMGFCKPYTPKSHARFWCNKCDLHVIDSKDDATGNFFVVSGHILNCGPKFRDGMEISDEWEIIIFAICNHCQKGV